MSLFLKGDVDSGATFSLDEVYRYALWRRFEDSSLWPNEQRRWCAFVALNPSTADHELSDPTVTRMMRFAADRGLRGLILHNLFAFRSTDPAALYGTKDPIGPGNDAALQETLSRTDLGAVICAWGAHPLAASRGREVVASIRAAGHKPLCLGRTKAGAPKHPLYLRADTEFVSYEG